MVVTEAPIIIPDFDSIKKHCSSCAYKYNYILGNPTVTIRAEGSKNKYLEIKTYTQDTDEIDSKLIKGRGRLREARLYCPAQNDYKNITSGVVAELVLIHSNSNSRKDETLSVCIPIKSVSTKGSKSDLQFSEIINSLSGRGNRRANDEIPISTVNFTLNKFIPASRYIVLESVKGIWDSSSEREKNNILIFTPTEKTDTTVKILKKDLNKLKELINSDGTTTTMPTSDSGNIRKYDKVVGSPGLNQSSKMKCYPIDLKTGKRIKPGFMSLSDGDIVGYEKAQESSVTGTGIVIAVVGVLLLIGLLGLGYTFYKRLKLKVAKSASNMATNAAGNIGANIK